MSKQYVVVIGRQFGSGGHEIGVRLAEKLGIPLYDKEILAHIAREQGLEEERIHKMDENLQGNRLLNIGLQAQGKSLFESGFLFETDTRSMITGDQVFGWQTAKIKELAEAGPCIIIGRCADNILRDYPGMISVFITAPLAAREARISRLYPNHPREYSETHLELILKTDKARANYYSFHTGRNWGEVGNYHLCLDSTKLGIEGTVEMLAAYIRLAVK